jgi:hypothetical protein
MCCVFLLCFILLFGFLLMLTLFFSFFFFYLMDDDRVHKFYISMSAFVFIWFSFLKDITTIMGCILLFATFRSKGRDP